MVTDRVSGVEIGEALSLIQQTTALCYGEAVRKGRFIRLVTTNTAWPPKVVECDSGEAIDGESLEAGDDGDYIQVCLYGFVKMETGGVFNAGDKVKSDNEGLPVKCLVANEALSGGKAYMHSTVAGDKIVVLVAPDVHGLGS